jgi:hypothetical protein
MRRYDSDVCQRNARNVQNDKLQKEFDAQSKENKGLCIAIGSKDADIAALKEKLSSMLQDKDLQIKAVRKVVRD